MGQTYNGWKNYETWAVALWLDNDAGSQEYWREATREVWETALDSKQVREWKFSREDAARILLADRLKDEVEEGNPVTEASLYADLMNAAISEVDWQEIAEHYVADTVAEAEVEREEAETLVGREGE